MNQEQFEALVKRLEGKAAASPRGYKLRVSLLALLGYVYVFGVLVVLLYVVALTVWGLFAAGSGGLIRFGGKIALALLVLVGIVLRAMWVRLEPPKGIALLPNQAPLLFKEVEEIRKKLKAPKVHQIQVDDEFNASMAEVPRLGIFGWPKGYLTLGLPYLQAFSPDQTRSTIAHELGHLSGSHSRFSGRVYRLRRTWAQILERLEAEKHWGAFMFVPFFGWYAPFLSAYSFVLARTHEYEADRYAAEVTGAQVVADKLTALHIKAGSFGGNFWPAVWKLADHVEQPPSGVYELLEQKFRQPVDHENAEAWLQAALKEETGYLDTHPCLRERLAALGYPLESVRSISREAWTRLLSAPEKSAAEYYLGDTLPAITAQFSAQWQRDVVNNWSAQYAQRNEKTSRLEALKTKSAAGSLTTEEEWELAETTAEIEGTEATIPLLEKILSISPTHVAANFRLGQVLLAGGDLKGLEYLEQAMEHQPDCIIVACETAGHYLQASGQEELAAEYQRRALTRTELVAQAAEERSDYERTETYRPHGLTQEQVQAIRSQLKRHPRLKQAYLVRREVRYMPEDPGYVLCLVPRKPWYEFYPTEEDVHLRDNICQFIEFPFNAKVFLKTRKHHSAWEAMTEIPGSEIYAA